MAKKKFGQYDHFTCENGGLRMINGYFIRHCECGKRVYLTKTELVELLKTKHYDLPLREIMWERFLNIIKIPKVNLSVEWRGIEEWEPVPFERSRDMSILRQSGWSLEKIGRKYGVSKQRVWAILQKA